MKKIINKLICKIFGHQVIIAEYMRNKDCGIRKFPTIDCYRCGKTLLMKGKTKYDQR